MERLSTTAQRVAVTSLSRLYERIGGAPKQHRSIVPTIAATGATMSD